MPEKWQQWYPHSIDLWLRSATVAALTDAGYRAFHCLLMAQFQSSTGTLPDDAQWLARQSRMGMRWAQPRGEMPSIADEVLAYFPLQPDGTRAHPYMLATWEDARSRYEVRERGIAQAREKRSSRSCRASDSIIRTNIDSNTVANVDSITESKNEALSIVNDVSSSESSANNSSDCSVDSSTVSSVGHKDTLIHKYKPSSSPTSNTKGARVGASSSSSLEDFPEQRIAARCQALYPLLSPEHEMAAMRAWIVSRGAAERRTLPEWDLFALRWLARSDSQLPRGAAPSGRPRDPSGAVRPRDEEQDLRAAGATEDCSAPPPTPADHPGLHKTRRDLFHYWLRGRALVLGLPRSAVLFSYRGAWRTYQPWLQQAFHGIVSEEETLRSVDGAR